MIQADGLPIASLGMGTVHGIDGTHCVPGLDHQGLLSVATMVDRNIDSCVVFSDKGVKLCAHSKIKSLLETDPSIVLSDGPRVRNLYYLPPEETAKKNKKPLLMSDSHPLSVMPARSTRPHNRAMLWHQRCGHVPWPELLHMKKAGTNGIDFTMQE